MGGYDLYGNYYRNAEDAWDAETAQMNEIDNRRNKEELVRQQREINKLKQKVKELEAIGEREC